MPVAETSVVHLIGYWLVAFVKVKIIPALLMHARDELRLANLLMHLSHWCKEAVVLVLTSNRHERMM